MTVAAVLLRLYDNNAAAPKCHFTCPGADSATHYSVVRWWNSSVHRISSVCFKTYNSHRFCSDDAIILPKTYFVNRL